MTIIYGHNAEMWFTDDEGNEHNVTSLLQETNRAIRHAELCRKIDDEFARFLRGDLTAAQTKHEILMYLDKRKGDRFTSG